MIKRNIIFLTLALTSLLPNEALSEVITLECSYPREATPSGVKKQDFAFSIVYDSTQGKAYMLADNGRAELAVIEGVESLTFLEVTPWGNVNTTAVIWLQSSNLSRLTKSVHNRNPAISGEFVPSQNYGDCKWN